MSHRSDEASEQVEHDESAMAHGVLDVIAEDPQVEHVADQMHEAPVKKHAREDAE